MVVNDSWFHQFSRWTVVNFKRFHHNQSGGAYTLSYVMTIPFLMLLVALTVESALLLTSKIGTIYAAHAAVRCTSVYTTGHSWTDALQKAQLAARQAMLPFACGSTFNAGSTAPQGESDAILSAYEKWSPDGVSRRYLAVKAADAANRINLEFLEPPKSWDAEIVAVVTYDYPFRLPGIGRLLGHRDETGDFVFPIRSRATLINDAPQNTRQHLGIGYGNP